MTLNGLGAVREHQPQLSEQPLNMFAFYVPLRKYLKSTKITTVKTNEPEKLNDHEIGGRFAYSLNVTYKPDVCTGFTWLKTRLIVNPH